MQQEHSRMTNGTDEGTEERTSLAPHAASDEAGRLGLVWIYCPYPVLSLGLTQILAPEARVHAELKPPEDVPGIVILVIEAEDELLESMKQLQSHYSDAAVVVLGLRLDLALARAALRAGGRGFIHAKMQPGQMIRALSVAAEGQIAAPRELLEYLLTNNEPADLDSLSSRQREILGLVGEGLSNAEIAERLFLSESTVKQHLRAAYKVLGVSNRTEAAKLLLHG
jgi:DNA-binding NarL/FixJ family response regulator